MSRPRPFVTAVAIAFSTMIGACRSCHRTSGPAPDAAHRVLREAIYSEPGSFDPREQSEAETFSILYPLMETLVDIDPRGAAVPALAESWSTNDNRRWIFHLRPKVRFHANRCFGAAGPSEVSADDVLASLNRSLLPGSTGRALLADIVEGAEKFDHGATTADGIREIDPHTIEIDLAKPYPHLLDRLALPFFFILPEHCLKNAPGELKRNPVGTGPFRFSETVPGFGVRLVRNEQYWRSEDGRALPHLAGVEFRYVVDPAAAITDFLAGALDAVEVPATMARQLSSRVAASHKAIRQLETTALDTHYFAFRVDRPPFKGNLALRQALNLMVDKHRITDVLLGGYAVPSRGVFPPSLFDDPPFPEAYPYDPDRAKKLLSQAGFPGGKGLAPLVLGIDNKPTTEAVAVYVREELAKFGVAVTLKTMDLSTLIAEASKGTLDFFYMFVEGDLTGDYYAQQVDGPPPEDGGLNFSHELDAGIASLHAQAGVAPQEAAARSAWRALNQAAVDSAPWLFLYHTRRVRLVQPNIVGYEHDPIQIRRYLRTRFEN